MKILAIRGANLASLKGPFEVDLDAPPLRHLGLFAIAGPVGAGKSTLLDAMCLALFNRTPRLSGHGGAPVIKDQDAVKSNDPRSLVRRGVAGAFAEVDVRGIDGRVYRARWHVRRARGQAFGKLQSPELSLIDIVSGARIGEGTTDTLACIEEKVGLSFEQLCRSMLLAQGSFSSFLHAKPEERAALLEKITGTELYSTLSTRAFGRARAEEAALRALEEQMRALAPADAHRRRALEEADACAVALTVERARIVEEIEAAVRFHARTLELAAAVRDGERARSAAERARASSPAAERARVLVPVWPLRSTWRALDAARATNAHALLEGCGARDEQRVADELVASLVERSRRAAAALAQRAHALALAEPLLERAVILDEQLARAHVPQLVDEHTRAADDDAQLAAALDEASAMQREAGEALARAQQGLRAEPALAPLLGVWPTVRALLEQLARIDTNREGAAALAQVAHTRRDAAQIDATHAAAALAEAHRVDADAEHAVLLLCAAGTGGDAPITVGSAAMALAEMAALIDGHQRALHAGAQLKRTLEERCAEEATAVERERAAERAHRVAADELVRANAMAARAALVDGEPCPLCGSLDHPISTTLLPPTRSGGSQARDTRAPAAHLREAAEARAVAHARTVEATQALTEHAGVFRLARDALTPTLRSCTADTLAHATTALDRWRTSVAALEGVRTAAHTAAHALALESAALLFHTDALGRLDDERLERAASLAELLGDREAAAVAEPRLALKSMRARIDVLKAHEEEASKASGRLADAERTARVLEVRAAGGAARTEQLRLRVEAARHEHARCMHERAALLPGADDEPPAQVRARLVVAVDDARMVDADATLALAEARVRAREAERRGVDRGNDERRARDALAQLETSFADLVARAALDPADVAASALLDDDALDNARTTMRDLDAALARADAVLAERCAAAAAHGRSALPAAIGGSDGGVAARAQLVEATNARGACAAALLHDDEVRARADALAPVLETQRTRAKVWSGLADVIGSADGARFRVFAQSLTLDTLLVRSNEQLAMLAPRYRLERVPSEDKRPRFDLELVVVDRESGDEPRAIASLSGGETFLVSLALALALSSLSSSLTLVESLFIDEGFSSLDTETLDATLAALEALRASGRQIGVISHVAALVERIGAQVRIVPLGGGRSRVDVRAS